MGVCPQEAQQHSSTPEQPTLDSDVGLPQSKNKRITELETEGSPPSLALDRSLGEISSKYDVDGWARVDGRELHNQLCICARYTIDNQHWVRWWGWV